MKQVFLDSLSAYGLTIFTVIAKFVIDYIKAHIRNAHIQTATSLAEQVVNYISYAIPDADSATKKAKAVDELTKRLNTNKIGVNFTDEQVNNYIELAYTKLKGLLK